VLYDFVGKGIARAENIKRVECLKYCKWSSIVKDELGIKPEA